MENGKMKIVNLEFSKLDKIREYYFWKYHNLNLKGAKIENFFDETSANFFDLTKKICDDENILEENLLDCFKIDYKIVFQLSKNLKNWLEKNNFVENYKSYGRFGKFGSHYFFNEAKNELIRISDHWGTGIRSCDWLLNCEETISNSKAGEIDNVKIGIVNLNEMSIFNFERYLEIQKILELEKLEKLENEN